MPRCPRADVEAHLLATQAAQRVFVLALKSYYLEAEVSNDQVADYVRRHPERLVGFAAVDPTRPKEAIDELREFEAEKLISEDDLYKGRDQIQELTDKYVAESDEVGQRKEEEIREV